MPRGDKSKYTDKQKQKVEHVAEGYEYRGVLDNEAERRAWATINKESGGGKKSGSGRGKPESHAWSRKGGESEVQLPPRGPRSSDRPRPRRRLRPVSGTMRLRPGRSEGAIRLMGNSGGEGVLSSSPFKSSSARRERARYVATCTSSAAETVVNGRKLCKLETLARSGA
jgi:hypothetical protein